MQVTKAALKATLTAVSKDTKHHDPMNGALVEFNRLIAVDPHRMHITKAHEPDPADRPTYWIHRSYLDQLVKFAPTRGLVSLDVKEGALVATVGDRKTMRAPINVDAIGCGMQPDRYPDWRKVAATPEPNGGNRAVFDPTYVADAMRCANETDLAYYAAAIGGKPRQTPGVLVELGDDGRVCTFRATLGGFAAWVMPMAPLEVDPMPVEL